MSDDNITETTEAIEAETGPGAEDSTAEATDAEGIEEPDNEPDDDKAMNSEAAKWRRRLRETQAELEQVTAQLDAVQRQQVELLLADTGVKPTAVWSVTSVAELLGDDGAIDTDKVSAAVEAARERFGIPKLAKGNHIPAIGSQPAGKPKGDTWTAAFAPGRRR